MEILVTNLVHSKGIQSLYKIVKIADLQAETGENIVEILLNNLSHSKCIQCLYKIAKNADLQA